MKIDCLSFSHNPHLLADPVMYQSLQIEINIPGSEEIQELSQFGFVELA